MASTALALVLVFGVGECAPLAAPHAAAATTPASHEIVGQLSIVGGKADLEKLEVRINGTPARIAADGSITGIATDADHVQLAIRGPGIFETVFTFSPSELAGADGRWSLPAVEAVARVPGRVELFFGGDVMMGRRFEDPIWNERVLIHPESRAADMARLLEPMKPYFAGADLASVNLETVLATRDLGDAPDKSVVFYTHSDAAKILADAGIDFVTLGNNHVYDYVEPGLVSTLTALDAAGLPWSGAGRNEAEAAKAARLDAGGHAWSMLGFVGWKGKVEPNQIAESGKGGAAFGSDEAIEEAVRREVKAGRAPIVQYHGSSEYSDRPTDISERRMKLAIDSGAALVVSHHPHVSHGLELYKGRLIAYSLGNFLFDQYFPETQATYALKVWMDGDRLFRAEMIPIQLLDYRPVPAVAGMRQAVLRRIIELSAERGTRVGIVGGHGVIEPSGAIPAPTFCAAPAEAGLTAFRYDLHHPAAACAAAAPTARDLFLRGDFEAARYDDARDRSWGVDGGTLDFVNDAHRGTTAMAVAAAGAAPVTIAPKTFFRPVAQRRLSFSGWVNLDAPATLELLLQEQPKGSGRTKALESAPLRPMGSQQIAAGGWQYVRFDIDRGADASALPLRPLLRISGAPRARLDDLLFLAWDSDAPGGASAPGRAYTASAGTR
jgi:poly-gamma-glutamate capsule biosynthesis protein CapA/YwtB (metallophosphatase superfamily)